MTLYDEVVGISKDYMGFVAELFVTNTLLRIKKTKATFEKKDLPDFVDRIKVTAAKSLTPDQINELTTKLLALSG